MSSYIDKLVQLGYLYESCGKIYSREGHDIFDSEPSRTELIEILVQYILTSTNEWENPLLDVRQLFPDEYDFVMMELMANMIIKFKKLSAI